MKAHTLHRLLASIYGKPILISKQGFQSISAYLHSRNSELMTFHDVPKEPEEQVVNTFDINSGIGILTVRGPLTYRTTGLEALCGGYSYEMLLSQASEMIEAGVKCIVIDADSGGGEAYGCFEVTDELRKMCDANNVKLLGYIDGNACSAMYAIICACDEISINPLGEAGSIGVLIALCNDSEHLKQDGYERIFISDGSDKVPFADDGTFKPDFITNLETKVASLGDAFREHVSKYTGISTEALKNTNARVYSATESLSMGLVNHIQTRSEFISYVMSKIKE